MGVGKVYPSSEATNASTEMQVSAFDMYSGLPIPLGNVNDQEHCATVLVGSKLIFVFLFTVFIKCLLHSLGDCAYSLYEVNLFFGENIAGSSGF